MSTMFPKTRSKCGLQLLSIGAVVFNHIWPFHVPTSVDGGGIRGLPPLTILKEILFRMQQEQNLPDIPRPCDIFDWPVVPVQEGRLSVNMFWPYYRLSARLIVIMLFRLQMTSDAIKAYTTFASYLAYGSYRSLLMGQNCNARIWITRFSIRSWWIALLNGFGLNGKLHSESRNPSKRETLEQRYLEVNQKGT